MSFNEKITIVWIINDIADYLINAGLGNGLVSLIKLYVNIRHMRWNAVIFVRQDMIEIIIF